MRGKSLWEAFPTSNGKIVVTTNLKLGSLYIQGYGSSTHATKNLYFNQTSPGIWEIELSKTDLLLLKNYPAGTLKMMQISAGNAPLDGFVELSIDFYTTGQPVYYATIVWAFVGVLLIICAIFATDTVDDVRIIPTEELRAMMTVLLAKDRIQEPREVILAKGAGSILRAQNFLRAMGLSPGGYIYDTLTVTMKQTELNKAVTGGDLYPLLQMIKAEKEETAAYFELTGAKSPVSSSGEATPAPGDAGVRARPPPERESV